MCEFFSCISDGKGTVLYFTPTQIAEEMSTGNKESYDWNSHTSIARYNHLSAMQEDRWNKWEYNVKEKKLRVDSLYTEDDRNKVKKVIQSFLRGKDIAWMQNIYNRNSGNRNSGNMNSGNNNSGYRNSGDMNSGDRNSGYMNSGSLINHFCTVNKYLLFDIECTKEEASKVYSLGMYQYFKLNEWFYDSSMTRKEKKDNPDYKILGGYLKIRTYKEAWKLVPKTVLKEIKKLKNFDAKKFEIISGLKI